MKRAMDRPEWSYYRRRVTSWRQDGLRLFNALVQDSDRIDTRDAVNLDKIINVASVKQRSPFRYPGGKTWLVPHVRKWLESLPAQPRQFAEPFAGGAIVGLTVAFENLATHVTLIELDREVADVWRAIVSKHNAALVRRILSFEMSTSNARSVIASRPRSVVDRAFKTILKNRVQHGGILANGASLMNKGENGKGVASRWYAETITKRIADITTVQDRITFRQMDGLAFIRENKNKANWAWFIDPPYTVAGRRLYTHHEIDHEALFKLASEIKGNVLIIYDKSDEVISWARKYGFCYECVAMKSRQHYSKQELLIGRNLDWARSSQQPASSTGFGRTTR